MAWKHLQIGDLRLILSEDETKQLNQYSLDADVSDVINSTMDVVSDVWRGALSAKGYELDVRDHYVPPEYAYYILVHCRHAVWTRFPNSESIALDGRRKEEYEKAMDLLRDPFIDVSSPTDEGVPDTSGEIGTGAGSIRVPWNRIPAWYLTDSRQSLELRNYF